jgi:MarR family transcriptional regulator, organic hydroperoxide resistance regulator
LTEKPGTTNRDTAVLFDEFFRRAGGWIKHQFNRQVEKHNYDLTPAQYKVLILISHLQPCRMSDLSEAALVSTSSLTIMLNRLVDDGLVERLSAPEDRRVIKVQLTEKGKVLLKKVHEGYLDVLEGVVASLEEPKKEVLLKLLLEVKEIMDDLGNRYSQTEGRKE